MTNDSIVIDDTFELITCRMCGVRKRELNGHLRMHRVSTAEYIALHPGAPIISEASSQKKSSGVARSWKENPQNHIVTEQTRAKLAEASRNMHARKRQEDPDGYLSLQRANAATARAAKGEDYTHSDETLQKMRGPRLHLRGIPKSEDTKKKLSAARLGRQFGPHKPETIAKMKAAWDRRRKSEGYDAYIALLSERGRSEERTARLRSMMAERIKNGGHNGRSKDTALEKRFEKFLVAHGIAFETQRILKSKIGDFAFDFYLQESNMLVEVDGEYWHRMSLEQHNRDKIKERLAAEQGYRFCRISDLFWVPEMVFSSEADIQENNRLLMEERVSHLPPARQPTRRRRRSPQPDP